MEDTNQTTESHNPGTETATQGSPTAGRLGRWVKNTVYGFAGLAVLALVITVISPESAVAVSQYLPKEYQETIFASAGDGQTCSAGMPVASYSSCCQAKTSCCSAGPTSCPMSGAEESTDEVLAVDIPSLSLDNMLEGLGDL